MNDPRALSAIAASARRKVRRRRALMPADGPAMRNETILPDPARTIGLVGLDGSGKTAFLTQAFLQILDGQIPGYTFHDTRTPDRIAELRRAFEPPDGTPYFLPRSRAVEGDEVRKHTYHVTLRQGDADVPNPGNERFIDVCLPDYSGESLADMNSPADRARRSQELAFINGLPVYLFFTDFQEIVSRDGTVSPGPLLRLQQILRFLLPDNPERAQEHNVSIGFVLAKVDRPLEQYLKAQLPGKFGEAARAAAAYTPEQLQQLGPKAVMEFLIDEGVKWDGNLDALCREVAAVHAPAQEDEPGVGEMPEAEANERLAAMEQVIANRRADLFMALQPLRETVLRICPRANVKYFVSSAAAFTFTSRGGVTRPRWVVRTDSLGRKRIWVPSLGVPDTIRWALDQVDAVSAIPMTPRQQRLETEALDADIAELLTDLRAAGLETAAAETESAAAAARALTDPGAVHAQLNALIEKGEAALEASSFDRTNAALDRERRQMWERFAAVRDLFRKRYGELETVEQDLQKLDESLANAGPHAAWQLKAWELRDSSGRVLDQES